MSIKKYNYVFDAIAESNLDEILNYISVQLSNPKAAGDLLNDFMKAIERIREFPDSGTVRLANIRRVPVNGYLLYYIPLHESKTIHILKITHGSQKFENENLSN